MTGTFMPIRAIPKHGGADLYLDPSKLTEKQHKDLQAELEKQDFFIQYLYMADPTHLLVEAEVRLRLEAERSAK